MLLIKIIVSDHLQLFKKILHKANEDEGKD